MGKSKSIIDAQVEEQLNIENEKDIEIKGAALKDHQCTYSYELLTGKTRGDEVTRKGVHLIHEDLDKAFQELDIFAMHIDDYFKNDLDVNNQTPLAKLEEHGDLSRYTVTSFKITGIDENRAVVLTCRKSLMAGVVSYALPKIKLEGSYLYIEELKERLRIALNEVEAYMNGKSAPKYEQLDLIESFEREDSIDLAGAEIE